MGKVVITKQMPDGTKEISEIEIVLPSEKEAQIKSQALKKEKKKNASKAKSEEKEQQTPEVEKES